MNMEDFPQLSYADYVRVRKYLIETAEKENILGDVEPCDITGW